MSDRLPSLLSLLLAIAAAGAVLTASGAATAAATDGHAAATTPTPVTPEGANGSGAVVVPNMTTFAVQLHEDGDATWTVTAHFEVTTERERSAFLALADSYERGETPALGLDAFRSANDAAEQQSGRSMDITDVERTSDANASTLSLRFRWTNFARHEGDSLIVDDAFNTSNGTWFDSLSESQVLIVDVPEGYGFLSAPRGFEDGRIRWDGPQEFEPGYFQIEYSGSVTGPVDRLPSLDDVPLEALVAIGIVVAALGGYAAARHRQDGTIGTVLGDAREKAGAAWTPPNPVDAGSGGAPSGGGDRTADAAATAESGAGGSRGGVAPSDEAGDTDGVDAGEGPDAGEGATATATGADELTDEELLSDEERVELLLEENGGRMKQANIVKETGWSNAKVSQLLSAMADEDRISKLRIGRENLISFPDEDVTDDEE